MSERRVFITGASSGLGAALARHYAGAGAQLGLLARREEALQALVQTLPGTHHIYAADVANQESLVAAAQDYIARVGLPDIVIANAGVSVGTLTEYAADLPVFQCVLQTNVLGMVATFQPFVALMRKAERGKLVGIASVAGIRGLPGAGAYGASKAAVISYLESLRVELRGSGMEIITLCPGYIETPMTAVNRYRMPFILSADEAARRIAIAIAHGTSYAVIPWQMALVAKLMRLLPNALYDRLAVKAGRKPRGLL